jgi:CO/xanthine dehydrogenase Mo-binding subunit
MEPTAAEVPRVETLICEDAPSPDNPLGLKGAGEGGTVGCGAAIVSAVEDALEMPGSITALPVNPSKIRSLLRDSSSADSARTEAATLSS